MKKVNFIWINPQSTDLSENNYKKLFENFIISCSDFGLIISELGNYDFSVSCFEHDANLIKTGWLQLQEAYNEEREFVKLKFDEVDWEIIALTEDFKLIDGI